MNTDLQDRVKEFMEEMEKDSVIESVDILEDKNVYEFKNNVYLYTELDKKIEELNKQILPLKNDMKPLLDTIKESKNKKKDIEEKIITFMNSITITHCNLPNKTPDDRKGALECSEQFVKKSITEAYVKERIHTFFYKVDNNIFNNLKPDERANTLYDFIYKARPKIKKQVIKKVPYQITS